MNYMSPEQTTGGVIDGRSDVFSLGVLLYECLSGENPFVRPHVGPVVAPDFLSVLHVEPRPLDHIPLPLWHVIRRALAKNVHERFASADELARALAAAVPSFPGPLDLRSSTIPPPTTAPLPTVRPPHRLSSGIAMGTLVALLGALALTSLPSKAHSAARSERARTDLTAAVHAKRFSSLRDTLDVSAKAAEAGGVFPTYPRAQEPRLPRASRSGAERDVARGLFAPWAVPARRSQRVVLRDPGF
jgi:serine/threonine protein kinase